MVERLCDLKIYLTMLLSKLRPMPYSVLQDQTMLFPPTKRCWVRVCGLGPDLVGIHSNSLAARSRTAACSNTLSQGLQRRPKQLVGVTLLRSSRSALFGTRNFSLLPWLVALRKRSIWYVVWAVMANLMILHKTRSRRLPQPCSATHYIGRISLDRSPYGLPRFWDRSVVFELWRFCLT